MRISNAIRKIEDATLRTTPALRSAARKTAMTAVVVIVVPAAVVATATLGAIDAVEESARTLLRGSSAGIKAIREV